MRSSREFNNSYVTLFGKGDENTDITEQEAADIAEHMANCDDCSGEHLIGLTLTEKVRKACNEKAPEDLRTAILSRLAGV